MSDDLIKSIQGRNAFIRANIQSGGQLIGINYDALQKGKKMPLGTISNGRRKIAEGKWVPVKEGDSKKSSTEVLTSWLNKHGGKQVESKLTYAFKFPNQEAYDRARKDVGKIGLEVHHFDSVDDIIHFRKD